MTGYIVTLDTLDFYDISAIKSIKKCKKYFLQKIFLKKS